MSRPTRPALASAALLALAATGCGGDAGDAPAASASLARGCIRATACGVQRQPRVSNCLDFYRQVLVPQGVAPLYDRIYRCANAAKSCAAVRACFGASGRCEASFAARCDGATAVSCDLLDHTVHRYDCAAAGLRCEVDAQQRFAARCAGAPGVSSTLDLEVDCSDGACAKTSFGCTADAFNRCAGEDLQACIGGRWVTYRCRALGLGPCVTSGGWGRCTAP